MAIHDKHEEFGDFVRLSPSHVSIAHPESIRDVLGHGNGFTKSDFYYAFDNIEQGIFTTRDRDKHARKRKYVSHVFSPKAMLDFEPYVTHAIAVIGRQMDSLINTGVAGKCVDLANVDEKIVKNGRTKKVEWNENKEEKVAAIDAAKWWAFLAFDIISDLAFGEPFGFCEAGEDINSGIQKLRDRGEWCCTVGQMPWIKEWTPYFFFDRFFVHGLRAAQALGRIGIAAVERRKNAKHIDPKRKDILYYLLAARDPDTGEALPDRELQAEALTQLIAGSDTTGNTLTHITDMLCRHPDKARALREELDTAFPASLASNFVAPFSRCKDLLYLQAVIYETLRLRTTVSVGLPRVVPAVRNINNTSSSSSSSSSSGTVTVCGQAFKPGTVLSTPTYTVHRDRRIWGDDALAFRPERWLVTDDSTGAGGGDPAWRFELEKHFLGFSYGPRACIGRNVAMMELKKGVATLFRRFEYRLVDPQVETYIREGFHLKCQGLRVWVSRR